MSKSKSKTPPTDNLGKYTMQEVLDMPQEQFDSLRREYSGTQEEYTAIRNETARMFMDIYKKSATEKLAEKLLVIVELIESLGISPEEIIANFVSNAFQPTGDIQD